MRLALRAVAALVVVTALVLVAGDAIQLDADLPWLKRALARTA